MEGIRHQAAIHLRLATIRTLHIITVIIMAVIPPQLIRREGIRTHHQADTLHPATLRLFIRRLAAMLMPTLLQATRRRTLMGLHRQATVSRVRPGTGRTLAQVGQMMTGRAAGGTTTAAKAKEVAGVGSVDGHRVASRHQGEVAEIIRARSGRRTHARRQARVSV